MNQNPNNDDTATEPSTLWLRKHRVSVEKQRESLRAMELRWTWGRLLLFITAVTIWIPWGAHPFLAGAASAALLVCFALAVRRHRTVRRSRELSDRTLTVIDESLCRSDGQVTRIRTGLRPRDPDDPTARLDPILHLGPVASLTEQERDDLDLYADPVGIYGLLDRASTLLGARRLRDILDHPSLSADHITARQHTLRWFTRHPAKRLRLLAAAAELRDRGPALDQLVSALRNAKPLPERFRTRTLQVWSAITALFVAASIVQIGLGSFGWIFPLLAWWSVNAILFLLMRPALRTRLDPWRSLVPTLRGYRAIANHARADLPEDTELAQLRARFDAVARRDALPALCNRVPWADTGGVFHAACNTLIFYDLHVASAVLKTVLQHRDTLLAGLSTTADLEALLSLACFAAEQPAVTWPNAHPDSVISITAGTHPLIDPHRAVPNDVTLSPETRVWIITGSNMAGKSTLLRMVGTNLLLAQIGSAVPAREMSFSPVRLVTDLRARDNLARDESYYLAEVRQLRRLVCPEDDTSQLLGLIDEPFRGTNSDEQVAASLAVLRHLLDSRHYFLIATHERRLTELADETAARNFHFTENLDHEGMTFDYSLRPGPATTRNAIRILERENYPPAVIHHARQHLPPSLPGRG